MADLALIYGEMEKWVRQGQRSIRIELSTHCSEKPSFQIWCYDFNLAAGCLFRDWSEFDVDEIANRMQHALQDQVRRIQEQLAAVGEAVKAR